MITGEYFFFGEYLLTVTPVCNLQVNWKTLTKRSFIGKNFIYVTKWSCWEELHWRSDTSHEAVDKWYTTKKNPFAGSLLNCMPRVLKTCSRAKVSCMLTCSRASVSCVYTCSRAIVPCVLTCSRTNVSYVAYVLTHQRVLRAYVLTCQLALRANWQYQQVSFLSKINLLPCLVLEWEKPID